MKHSRALRALALLTTIFAAGCETSGNGSGPAVPIPDLDPRDRADCPVPADQVDGRKMLVDTTRWATCERGKRRNVISQYDEVRDKFGPQ